MGRRFERVTTGMIRALESFFVAIVGGFVAGNMVNGISDFALAVQVLTGMLVILAVITIIEGWAIPSVKVDTEEDSEVSWPDGFAS